MIPKVWKSANVSALFKNGSKSEPLNYRPAPATWPFISLYLKQNSIIHEIENSGPCWGNERQVLNRLVLV